MKKLTKVIAILLSVSLLLQQVGFAQVAGTLDISGFMTSLRQSITVDKFRPLHLRYLAYDNINNNFKLLLDKGDIKNLKSAQIEETSKKLLNLFFVGVTLPNDSFWVNLRPDSPDKMLDPMVAQTDVGKVFCEADLQLKKDTAKFTSPDTAEGKEYWNKLYQKAGEIFGSENITIPTLTRPWIVPDEIIIRESTDNAYIYKATLKVLLEQDYLAGSATYNFKDERLKALNEYSSQLIRELIIPKLTKEINTSKRYASLRQVYYSLIMAQWFKQKFYGKGGLYSWLIDKQKLNGLTSKENWSKDSYFKEYQKSFQQGEYNFKEAVYTPYGQTIRSYFSGGIAFGENIAAAIPKGTIPASSPIVGPDGAIAQLSLNQHISSPINVTGGDVNDFNVKRAQVSESAPSPAPISSISSNPPAFTIQNARDVISSSMTTAALVSQISAVYNSALDLSGQPDDATRENLERLIERNKILVALKDGRVGGYIIHDEFGDRSGYLQMLMVAKDAQGDGLGSALMDGAIGRLRDSGVTKVKVEPEFRSGAFHNKYFHSRYPASSSIDFTRVRFAYVDIAPTAASSPAKVSSPAQTEGLEITEREMAREFLRGIIERIQTNPNQSPREILSNYIRAKGEYQGLDRSNQDDARLIAESEAAFASLSNYRPSLGPLADLGLSFSLMRRDVPGFLESKVLIAVGSFIATIKLTNAFIRNLFNTNDPDNLFMPFLFPDLTLPEASRDITDIRQWNADLTVKITGHFRLGLNAAKELMGIPTASSPVPSASSPAIQATAQAQPVNPAQKPSDLGSILLAGGVDANSFTALVYPAAGNYDDNLVFSLLKMFPGIQEVHLISLSYKEISADGLDAYGKRLNSRAREIGSVAVIHLHPLDYFDAQSRNLVSSNGRRIIIDKGPGTNASLRDDPRFYQSILEDTKPGDLVLAVPYARTQTHPWKQQMASGVSVPHYTDYDNWIVSLRSAEDAASSPAQPAASSPVSVSSPVQHAAPAPEARSFSLRKYLARAIALISAAAAFFSTDINRDVSGQERVAGMPTGKDNILMSSKPDIAHFSKSLNDADILKRLSAVEVLARPDVVTPEAAELLAGACKDANPAVRATALKGLAKAGRLNQPMIKQIIALLDDPNPDVRQEAADTLWSVKDINADGKIISALLNAAKSNDVSVRRAALNKLGLVGQRNQAVFEAFCQAFKDKERFDLETTGLLMNFDAAGIDITGGFKLLAEAFALSSDSIKREDVLLIVSKLGKGNPEALRIMLQGVDDGGINSLSLSRSDRPLWLLARFDFGTLDKKPAINKLLDMLDRGEDCAEQLIVLGRGNEYLKGELLKRRAMTKPGAINYFWVLSNIADLGDTQVIDMALSMLESGEPDAIAVKAVERLGIGDAATINKVINLAKDKGSALHKTYLGILGEIGQRSQEAQNFIKSVAADPSEAPDAKQAAQDQVKSMEAANSVSIKTVTSAAAVLRDSGKDDNADGYSIYKLQLKGVTVYCLVFASDESQTILDRLAFYAEKEGYKGRVLRDYELPRSFVYDGHDYSLETIAAFFTKAGQNKVQLQPREIRFRDRLLMLGLLKSEGEIYQAGEKSMVVSFIRNHLRKEEVFIHELVHAFYDNAVFLEQVKQVFMRFSPQQRELIKNFLRAKDYAVDSNENLLYSEFAAYFMTPNVAEFIGKVALSEIGGVGDSAARRLRRAAFSENPESFVLNGRIELTMNDDTKKMIVSANSALSKLVKSWVDPQSVEQQSQQLSSKEEAPPIQKEFSKTVGGVPMMIFSTAILSFTQERDALMKHIEESADMFFLNSEVKSRALKELREGFKAGEMVKCEGGPSGEGRGYNIKFSRPVLEEKATDVKQEAPKLPGQSKTSSSPAPAASSPAPIGILPAKTGPKAASSSVSSDKLFVDSAQAIKTLKEMFDMDPVVESMVSNLLKDITEADIQEMGIIRQSARRIGGVGSSVYAVPVILRQRKSVKTGPSSYSTTPGRDAWILVIGKELFISIQGDLNMPGEVFFIELSDASANVATEKHKLSLIGEKIKYLIEPIDIKAGLSDSHRGLYLPLGMMPGQRLYLDQKLKKSALLKWLLTLPYAGGATMNHRIRVAVEGARPGGAYFDSIGLIAGETQAFVHEFAHHIYNNLNAAARQTLYKFVQETDPGFIRGLPEADGFRDMYESATDQARKEGAVNEWFAYLIDHLDNSEPGVKTDAIAKLVDLGILPAWMAPAALGLNIERTDEIYYLTLAQYLAERGYIEEGSQFIEGVVSRRWVMDEHMKKEVRIRINSIKNIYGDERVQAFQKTLEEPLPWDKYEQFMVAPAASSPAVREVNVLEYFKAGLILEEGDRVITKNEERIVTKISADKKAVTCIIRHWNNAAGDYGEPHTITMPTKDVLKGAEAIWRNVPRIHALSAQEILSEVQSGGAFNFPYIIISLGGAFRKGAEVSLTPAQVDLLIEAVGKRRPDGSREGFKFGAEVPLARVALYNALLSILENHPESVSKKAREEIFSALWDRFGLNEPMLKYPGEDKRADYQAGSLIQQENPDLINRLMKLKSAYGLSLAPSPVKPIDIEGLIWLSRLSDASFAKALLKKVISTTEGYDVAGGILEYLRQNGHPQPLYLPVIAIMEEDLPRDYSTTAGLRAQAPVRPKPLSTKEIMLNAAYVIVPENDILFISRNLSGAQAAVKLAFLKNGSPVALRTYSTGWGSATETPEAELLKEYYAAQVADDLGIGPKVHGLIDNGDKIWIVTDVAPGDNEKAAGEMFINKDTMSELEEVRRRIEQSGFSFEGDFQYHVTPRGHIQVIDAVSLLNSSGERDIGDLREWIYLLVRARPSVQAEVLNGLSPDKIGAVSKALKKDIDSRARARQESDILNKLRALNAMVDRVSSRASSPAANHWPKTITYTALMAMPTLAGLYFLLRDVPGEEAATIAPPAQPAAIQQPAVAQIIPQKIAELEKTINEREDMKAYDAARELVKMVQDGDPAALAALSRLLNDNNFSVYAAATQLRLGKEELLIGLYVKAADAGSEYAIAELLRFAEFNEDSRAQRGIDQLANSGNKYFFAHIANKEVLKLRNLHLDPRVRLSRIGVAAELYKNKYSANPLFLVSCFTSPENFTDLAAIILDGPRVGEQPNEKSLRGQANRKSLDVLSFVRQSDVSGTMLKDFILSAAHFNRLHGLILESRSWSLRGIMDTVFNGMSSPEEWEYYATRLGLFVEDMCADRTLSQEFQRNLFSMYNNAKGRQQEYLAALLVAEQIRFDKGYSSQIDALRIKHNIPPPQTTVDFNKLLKNGELVSHILFMDSDAVPFLDSAKTFLLQEEQGYKEDVTSTPERVVLRKGIIKVILINATGSQQESFWESMGEASFISTRGHGGTLAKTIGSRYREAQLNSSGRILYPSECYSVSSMSLGADMANVGVAQGAHSTRLTYVLLDELEKAVQRGDATIDWRDITRNMQRRLTAIMRNNIVTRGASAAVFLDYVRAINARTPAASSPAASSPAQRVLSGASDGFLQSGGQEHRAEDAFQGQLPEIIFHETLRREDYKEEAGHLVQQLESAWAGDSLPVSLTDQEKARIAGALRGIEDGTYKIYGFAAIVRGANDFVLGRHNETDKTIFVAEDFEQRLYLADSKEFWHAYITYLVCYPIVGSERAIKIIQGLHPMLFFNGVNLQNQVPGKPYQGYLGGKIQRFVSRKLLSRQLPDAAGNTELSSRREAMFVYVTEQMNRLAEMFSETRLRFGLWQRIWVDMRSLNRDIFDFYALLAKRDKQEAVRFFKDATDLVVKSLTSAPFNIDIRYFKGAKGDPLKTNERVFHIYTSALTEDKGMPRIEEGVEWNESLPVIGWDTSRWDFDELTEVMKEGRKRNDARVVFFSDADIDHVDAKFIYINSGIVTDSQGLKVFVIFKSPVRLDVATYRDDEAYRDSITRIQPHEQGARILSVGSLKFLLDKGEQAVLFGRQSAVPDEQGLEGLLVRSQETPAPDTLVLASKGAGSISVFNVVLSMLKKYGSIVIKPAQWYGSRGVQRFHSGQQLEAEFHAMALLTGEERDIVIQQDISTDNNVRAYLYEKDGVLKTIYFASRGFPGNRDFVEEGLTADQLQSLDLLSARLYRAVKSRIGQDPVLLSADLMFDNGGTPLIIEVNPGLFSFTPADYSHGSSMPQLAHDMIDILAVRANSAFAASSPAPAPDKAALTDIFPRNHYLAYTVLNMSLVPWSGPADSLAKLQQLRDKMNAEYLNFLAMPVGSTNEIRQAYLQLAKTIKDNLTTAKSLVDSITVEFYKNNMKEGVVDAEHFADGIEMLFNDSDKQVDINNTLEKMLNLVLSKYYRDRGVKYEFAQEFALDIPKLNANQGDIAYLFLNLFLPFVLPLGVFKEARLTVSTKSESGNLVITVKSDQAPSMEDIMVYGQKINAGFKVAERVAKKYGGAIEVQSQGKEFIVKLPVAQQAGSSPITDADLKLRLPLLTFAFRIPGIIGTCSIEPTFLQERIPLGEAREIVLSQEVSGTLRDILGTCQFTKIKQGSRILYRIDRMTVQEGLQNKGIENLLVAKVSDISIWDDTPTQKDEAINRGVVRIMPNALTRPVEIAARQAVLQRIGFAPLPDVSRGLPAGDREESVEVWELNKASALNLINESKKVFLATSKASSPASAGRALPDVSIKPMKENEMRGTSCTHGIIAVKGGVVGRMKIEDDPRLQKISLDYIELQPFQEEKGFSAAAIRLLAAQAYSKYPKSSHPFEIKNIVNPRLWRSAELALDDIEISPIFPTWTGESWINRKGADSIFDNIVNGRTQDTAVGPCYIIKFHLRGRPKALPTIASSPAPGASSPVKAVNLLSGKTWPGRLSRLNPWFSAQAAQVLSSKKDKPLLVDMGIGFPPVTTVEWADAIPFSKVIGVDLNIPTAVIHVRRDPDSPYKSIFPFNAFFNARGELIWAFADEGLGIPNRPISADEQALAVRLHQRLNSERGESLTYRDATYNEINVDPLGNYNRKNLAFVPGDLFGDLPLEEQEADIIRVFNVLHRYQGRELEAVKNLGRYLSEGGKLVIGYQNLFPGPLEFIIFQKNASGGVVPVAVGAAVDSRDWYAPISGQGFNTELLRPYKAIFDSIKEIGFSNGHLWKEGGSTTPFVRAIVGDSRSRGIDAVEESEVVILVNLNPDGTVRQIKQNHSPYPTISSPAKDAKGGIDLRALPIMVQPITGDTLGSVEHIIPRVSPSVQPDKDLLEIQNMLASGITPSGERLKDYMAKCSDQQDMNKILSCLADIFRMEEDQAVATDPALRQFLVLLESGKNSQELKQELNKISFAPQEPELME